jgi:putative MATE family efflux protein
MSAELTPQSPPPGLLATLRDALSGSHDGAHHDFTEGPVGRSLLLLAIPMVLETLLESLFAVVDIFFVSRLGPDAVATVGLTESIESLVYAVAMGLGIGASAVVARRIGEKDPRAAARAAGQAILLGVLCAIPFGALGVLYAPELLGLLGGSPEVQRTGAGFTKVVMGGNLAVLLLFLINAVFRGAGDASIAMRSLWLASACNIVLGPLFVFGVGPFPRLGVTGAGVGTTIGRSIGVLYQISQLARRDGRFQLGWQDLVPDPHELWRVVKLSLVGVLQMLIGTSSWTGLVRVMAPFGSGVLAGYTISIRVIVFAFLPCWGLSNASATLVGQCLGAKKPERAERAVKLAALYTQAVMGGVAIVFEVFAPQIVGIFSSDPSIVPWAISGLRIVSIGFAFAGMGMVFTAAFNGAGDSWTPTFLSLACFWGLGVPLAWWLAKGSLGPQGVFIAIAVAFTLSSLLSWVAFQRGTWKTRQV